MKEKNLRSTTVPQNQGKQSLQSLILTNHDNRIDGAIKNWNTRQKAQISSIPGVSARERNRYRVVLNGEILATGLTSEQAFEMVKQGGRA
jgi:hypothetical protein